MLKHIVFPNYPKKIIFNIESVKAFIKYKMLESNHEELKQNLLDKEACGDL